MRVPKRKSEEGVNHVVDPHITQAKYDELAGKLERIKNSIPALAQEVMWHAKNGDFSENAPYQIAKGRLRGANQRILELNDLINRAVIIAPATTDGRVQLGSTVTVEINGGVKTYRILGSAETNPEKGVISHNSPLGAALMGHQAGEIVKLRLNRKEAEYKIIKIT